MSSNKGLGVEPIPVFVISVFFTFSFTIVDLADKPNIKIKPPSYNEATNCDQFKLTYENQNNQYPGGNQYPSPGGGPYPVSQHHPQCTPQDQVMLPLVTEPGAMVINRAPVTQNWMVPAVLTCLCCFWPTGIFAIIAASNANQAAANGDVIEAEKQSRKARSYVTVSFVIGIILIILGVVYRVALYSTLY